MSFYHKRRSAHGKISSSDPHSKDIELERLEVKRKSLRTDISDLTSQRAVDLADLQKLREHERDLYRATKERFDLLQHRGRLSLDAAAIGIAIFAIGPFIVNSLNDQVWLPAESMKINSGRVVTGYVISDSQVWITFLVDDDRTIIMVKDEDIVERKSCAAHKQYFENTIWNIGRHRPPSVSMCDKKGN
ncbi:hypothetical protein ACFQ9X_55550 [Catenulispora yoronensis]